MSWIWVVLGWSIVLTMLWDAFTAVVIPKTLERRLNISGHCYEAMWSLWQWISKRMTEGPARQSVLSAFAPFSLLSMFVIWALAMIAGFALVQMGHGSIAGSPGFAQYLYFSGETFFTLGYGDTTPQHGIGQWVSVLEAGTGFGFLALMIGYIPVLYGHFSTREKAIVKLDTRAGSNPTAGELIRRYSEAGAMGELSDLLKEWEDWSAEQLEAFLSYPVLAFYRSQHDHQSWLNALTTILDVCTLVEMGFEAKPDWERSLKFQARATFAMGRHVIVDLAYLLGSPPDDRAPDRLSNSLEKDLRDLLARSGSELCRDCGQVWRSRRKMYEPYCVSLARDLFFTLPGWLPDVGARDNWEITAWDQVSHF